MQTTTQPRQRDNSGRASARVAGQLRSEIVRGKLEAGQFLANERELARQFDVSRETLRRALKSLEREGFIVTVPRRGYRVLARGNDPEKGAPIAYVLAGTGGGVGGWTDRLDVVLAAFQKAAMRRGWPLLVVGAPDSAPGDVLVQLKATRACGLVLDTADRGLLEVARDAGIPAVIVNDWISDCEVDSVMQDGQHGGLLAAEHLAGRGRRRLAWVGPGLGDNVHAVDRFSGAAAGLDRAGLALAPELRVNTGGGEIKSKALELLSRADRPDGVIALWSETALAVASAARELELELGRDLDLVGWSVEELYESLYRPGFNGAPAAPAVTWSAAAMADAAVARLAERRTNPRLPALRIKVPVRLRLADEPAAKGGA
jgi:DNA-binding LacI/PurR family transcriptional regulator